MEAKHATTDESRRAAQHGVIKAKVVQDVNSDIAARAEHVGRDEAQEMNEVAGQLRGKAVDEVVDSDHEVRRARTLARVSQVVDYVFYVAYALLAIRFMLALIAARSTNGFVRFIHFVTEPLYILFDGIVGSPSAGNVTLVVPIIIAVIVYALLHLGVNRLLRLIARRQTTI